MKYKVGDKVKVKSLEWYNANKDEDGNVSNGADYWLIPSMAKHCGMKGTIVNGSKCLETYDISFDGINVSKFFWQDYMLEDPAQEPCEYCRDESRRALLSDEKYNESFVEVTGGELVMVTDDTYSTKINYCPMCWRKL